MSARRVLATLVALGAVLVVSEAHAMGGAYLGEPSRVAAQAGAVTAQPGDPGTMVQNPAGLGDVTRPQVLFGASAGRLTLGFARTGETSDASPRWLSSLGVAIGTPLPGPWWLSRASIGVALSAPAGRALDVRVDERSDGPVSPMYDTRASHIASTLGLGYRLLDTLSVGVGLTLTPSFGVPTEVTYVAGRGKTRDRDLVVRLGRDLELGFSPLVGLRASPLPWLSLGLAYRAASVVHAQGKNRTSAGGVLADDPFSYFQMWDPETLTFGVSALLGDDVRASADLSYERWSAFRTAFDEAPSPAFRSVPRARGAVDARVSSLVRVRAGYSYEPTPVPAQTRDSTFLGADTHVLGAGAALDLRPGLPLVVDAHVRAHVAATQRATKTDVPDARPELPGKQIENQGYPGFEARTLLLQAGLTMTWFLGRTARGAP